MFGFYKKLKDGFRKARKFISEKVIKPTIETIKKVKPMLEKVDLNKLKPIVPQKYQDNIDKLDDLRKKTIEYSDDVINLDDKLNIIDYQGALEYAGRQFIPRLKRK